MTFTSGWILGQSKANIEVKTNSVFFIGEEEKNYEKLVQNYNTMLFTVCANNMELAYENWSVLLKDLEDYSIKSNTDLKGVKLWLNVFWSKDGTIDHIVFYPKPNSKNLNYDNIKLLLANFIKTYQSPLKHTARFSHYGSAAFPVFSKTLTGTEK
ncbi:MAG: hypothetical protein WAU01_11480 [Saprospiraceae bacterium]